MAKDDTWRSAVEDAVSKRDVRKPGLQRESMAPKKPLPPPDKNKQPARPGFDHQQVSQRLRAKAVAHKIAAHGHLVANHTMTHRNLCQFPDDAAQEIDTNAEVGCIRDVAHAYTADGGLAVLHGNLAEDGAVIKSAGIDESLWSFRGPARVVWAF